MMNRERDDIEDRQWRKYAVAYDPVKIGSIDGTDSVPHDHAIVRAINSEYVPNKAVKGDPLRTLFIGRLNPRTKEDTVKSEFSKFGRILHCRLVRDIVTGKSRQYAFIEFESSSSLEKAYNSMHHEYIDGAEVIVEREAERRLDGWRPRRLGGGFGGRKESGQLRFGCRDRPFRKPILVDNRLHKDKERRCIRARDGPAPPADVHRLGGGGAVLRGARGAGRGALLAARLLAPDRAGQLDSYGDDY